MNDLTFLLYILSKSISSIKPALIEALRDWPILNPNLDLSNFDLLKFCKEIKLNLGQTQKFLSYFKNESKEKFLALLEHNQIKAINIFDSDYPSLLLQIPDPPLILYYRGENIKLLNTKSLAIVGSRKASSYGKLVVEKIISELRSSEITIISGLAIGIDTTSHQAALQKSLKTIAVLGSGIDDLSIYPKTNYNLAIEILRKGGLLISEYPPQTTSLKYQFVARNRIIAGLSQATIIAEAANKSGALLTVDFATEYNRSVYAVPGSIFSEQSSGTNNLISHGAQILSSTDYLLSEFGVKNKINKQEQKFTSNQLAVIKCMRSGAIELEKLLEQTKLPLSELLSILSEFEMNKIISQISTQVYQKLI